MLVETDYLELIKQDPKHAYDEIFGTKLAENVQVEVLQDTDTIQHVILPDPELEGAEMESIAGGVVPLVVIGMAAAKGAVAVGAFVAASWGAEKVTRMIADNE